MQNAVPCSVVITPRSSTGPEEPAAAAEAGELGARKGEAWARSARRPPASQDAAASAARRTLCELLRPMEYQGCNRPTHRGGSRGVQAGRSAPSGGGAG